MMMMSTYNLCWFHRQPKCVHYGVLIYTLVVLYVCNVHLTHLPSGVTACRQSGHWASVGQASAGRNRDGTLFVRLVELVLVKKSCVWFETVVDNKKEGDSWNE